MEPEIRVRAATLADLPRLNEIYNHYIRETAVTFDLEPWTFEQRREWFSHYGEAGPYRVLAAEDGDGVLGFTWSSPFRPKRAYDTTVETSIYCAPGATGRHAGTLLYAALFRALATEQLHRAVAGITLPNDASLALHQRFGFTPAGIFREVGYKFGRYWDVAWYEKAI